MIGSLCTVALDNAPKARKLMLRIDMGMKLHMDETLVLL